MRESQVRMTALVFSAISLVAGPFGLGACVLPSYQVTSSAGPGGSSGSVTASGGTGAATASQSGSTSQGGSSTQGGSSSQGGSTSQGGGGAGGTGGTTTSTGTGMMTCPGSPGCTEWVKTFGTSAASEALAVAAGAQDKIFVGGFYGDVLHVEPLQNLACAGAPDAFLARLDAVGTIEQAKPFSGVASESSDQILSVIASDPVSGNTVVAGYFAGDIGLPGSPMSNGQYDLFVAVLSQAGNIVWGKTFGGTSGDVATGASVDSDGNVLLTGNYQDVVQFGAYATKKHGVAGSNDVFLVKLNGVTGEPMWLRTCGGAGFDASRGVAVDDANGVTIVGNFVQTFTCDLIAPGVASADGTDAFVAHYDTNGQNGWLESFGGNKGVGDQSADAVSASGSQIHVAGSFNGGFYIDATHSSPALGSSSRDVFLMSLDIKGGVEWAGYYPDVGSSQALSLATAKDGSLVLAGDFAGSIDFGGGKVPAGTAVDAFVVKLDKSHAFLWQRVFAGTGNQTVRGVAFDAGGAVIAAGEYAGVTDFGLGELPALSASNGFVVKLQP